MADITLSKLVKHSLAKRISPKTFVPLYLQVHESGPVSDSDFIDFLVLSNTPTPKQHLKVQYVIKSSISSANSLSRFWKCLPKLDKDEQTTYLVNFTKILAEKLPPTTLKLLNTELVNDIVGYVNTSNEKTLANHIVLLVSSVIDKFSVPVDFKSFLTKFCSKLDEYNLQSAKNYLLVRASKVLDGVDLTEELEPQTQNGDKSAVQQLAKSMFSFNPSSKKAKEVNSLRQYIWLTRKMSNWEVSDVDQFASGYESQFGPFQPRGNMSSSHGYLLAYNLIENLFEGYCIACTDKVASYVLHNWRNFIVVRLPAILNTIKFPASTSAVEKELRQEFLDDVLVNFFALFKFDPVLVKDFVKSCIYSSLVSLNMFHDLFPDETNYNELVLNAEMEKLTSIPSIEDLLNVKLIEVNSEFTSLDESGLVEYVKSIPSLVKFSEAKQRDLNKYTYRVVDTLISTKEFEKLHRLILALLSDLETLGLIFFNDPEGKGPWTLIEKILQFFDSEPFNVDEDDNFQESYAYFGVISIGTILVVEHFDLDIKHLQMSDSYTLDYLNNFYYRMCDNLTHVCESSEEEDQTIVTNYNSLISDWINALFDDSNEGLSDDLIKSINVRQIYKIIPLIYHQAITAFSYGKIDRAILHNGIDYLSQAFLVPCSCSILRWLASTISLTKDAKLVEVLQEILDSNLGQENDMDVDGPTNHVFRLVLQVAGPETIESLKKVPDWQNSETITKINDTIAKFCDPLEEHKLEVTDANLLMQVRAKVSNLTEVGSIEERAEHYGFVYRAMQKVDHGQVLRFLVREMELYQRANLNEDSKIYMGFLVWLLSLDVSAKIEPKDFKDVEDETQFKLSMDYHYLIIFNDNGGGEEEDDLFNEPITKSPKISIFQQLEMARKYSTLAREVGSVQSHFVDPPAHEDEEVFRRAIEALAAKI